MMRGRFTWLSVGLARMYSEETHCELQRNDELHVNLDFEESVCRDGFGAQFALTLDLALYCFDRRHDLNF
jgi:hypothetical protein